ncbi:MAG: YIP1 family protein [Methanolobus sp.]|uniref:YIP1 family protein n=1 Tax=Methanolobus sp. TaxID=1874737 RepID=UPI0027302C94|nr:YIP1 family protein [Methanolobus sp.]MDP2216751.1 YIP1 family protein [Methanolobus sp.]
MLEVLTDPNGFFKRKNNEEIEFKTPLLIILLMAAVGAITAVIVMQNVIGGLPEEAAAFAGIGTVLAVVGAVIGTFVMWAVYSAIFYVISMLFNGEGSFKRVMEFVSYGFIPSIISSIISAIFTSRAYSNIDFTDPMIADTLLSDPTLRIAGIVGIIFMLWSANIWIFALVHSRNLSVKNAAITVGVPILLYVLYTLYTLRIFGA